MKEKLPDLKVFSLLDRPEILQFVFYPRKDTGKGPENARDYMVPVADKISVGCRFYICGRKSPSILFFHGNGEVAGDYDDIGPIYNRMGINLFVADYRGYGASNGFPTFAGMVGDAHVIYRAFRQLLLNGEYNGNIYIMGRSLGSISAVELAFRYQEELKGLIIESGFSSVIRLFRNLSFPDGFVNVEDDGFPNRNRIRAITIPTLIIHGEYDSIVPISEASDLYENSAGKNKKLLIIPGCGHNDIMMAGGNTYFQAIKEFVNK